MTELTLTDMGYYEITHTTGSENEEKAYGSDGEEGTALNLHAYSIKCEVGVALDKNLALQKRKNNSQIQRNEFGETDVTAVQYPSWTIEGRFKYDDESHMKDYGRLRHMVKTKGYKRLGFDSSETDYAAKIINYANYGENEYDRPAAEGENFVGVVEYINVRIESCTFEQQVSEGGDIIYTLTLVETN